MLANINPILPGDNFEFVVSFNQKINFPNYYIIGISNIRKSGKRRYVGSPDTAGRIKGVVLGNGRYAMVCGVLDNDKVAFYDAMKGSFVITTGNAVYPYYPYQEDSNGKPILPLIPSFFKDTYGVLLSSSHFYFNGLFPNNHTDWLLYSIANYSPCYANCDLEVITHLIYRGKQIEKNAYTLFNLSIFQNDYFPTPILTPVGFVAFPYVNFLYDSQNYYKVKIYGQIVPHMSIDYLATAGINLYDKLLAEFKSCSGFLNVELDPSSYYVECEPSSSQPLPTTNCTKGSYCYYYYINGEFVPTWNGPCAFHTGGFYAECWCDLIQPTRQKFIEDMGFEPQEGVLYTYYCDIGKFI